jgi:hypothetical protein
MNSNLSNIDYLLELNNVKSTNVDSINNIILHRGEFSIFQFNISSIIAHFNDLKILLGSVESFFDIIVLCETWLLNDYQFKLNGYIIINSLGNFNKSDGFTVLIRQSIKLLQIKKQILLNCYLIQFIFQIDKLVFSLICIYRSPNDNLELFLKGLDLILPQINIRYKGIICGDININIVRNSNTRNEYLNIIARYGFLSCINNFTRVSNHSKTCVNYIFIKNIDSNTVISNILRCGITDYYSTILIISNIINKKKIIRNNLLLNNIDINHLNLLIRTENWYTCLNHDNIM